MGKLNEKRLEWKSMEKIGNYDESQRSLGILNSIRLLIFFQLRVSYQAVIKKIASNG